MPTDERDAQILEQHLAGIPQKQIASQHNLSRETIRLVVQRETTRAVNDLELALMVGKRTGEWPALAVPALGGPDLEVALTHLQLMVRCLAERGVTVRLHYRAVPEAGIVVALEEA